jgi:hypothetical protein
MSVEGGGLTIAMGMFEENNPHLALYPSFRRNILCLGGGSINVVSLKGGDGLKDNSSLWILSSSDCSLSGLALERISPFFIPSVSNVSKEKVGSNYLFSIKGNLLLPCNLSFSLFISSEAITQQASNIIYFNETLFSGSTPLSTVDFHPSDELSIILLFPRFAESAGTTESSPFVIQNKSEEEDGDEGNLSQSGNPSSDPDSLPLFGYIIIILLALFSLSPKIPFPFVSFDRKEQE